MGFRTLAVTKQSSEVWKILEAVKTEFGKFSDQLEKVDKQLSTAKKSLEDLRSTRTNVMQRRLKDVGTLDTDESQAARHAFGTRIACRGVWVLTLQHPPISIHRSRHLSST